MIPMFRVLASGYSRITRPLPGPPRRCSTFSTVSATSIFSAGVAISEPSHVGLPLRCLSPPRGTPGPSARPRCARRSPSVVRERLVRLRHLVHVLAPLDRDALAVGGVHELAHQTVGHRVLLAAPR